MSMDVEDTKRLVQNYALEQENYLRQLHVWLGTASAGGAVAMATLAAHMPSPAYAFEYLALSFWCFLLGIISAGAAILALAMRASAKEAHFASAHNRENVNAAIRKIPEMFTSSKRENGLNTERNQLIEQSEKEHRRAEQAWVDQSRWKVAWATALIISSLSFISGFSWPLVQLSFLGKSIAPITTVKTQP